MNIIECDVCGQRDKPNIKVFCNDCLVDINAADQNRVDELEAKVKQLRKQRNIEQELKNTACDELRTIKRLEDGK